VAPAADTDNVRKYLQYPVHAQNILRGIDTTCCPVTDFA